MKLTFRQWLFRIRKEKHDDLRDYLGYVRSGSCPLTGVDKCNEIAKTNKAVLELSESLNHPKQEVTQEYISQLWGKFWFILVASLGLWVFILAVT